MDVEQLAQYQKDFTAEFKKQVKLAIPSGALDEQIVLCAFATAQSVALIKAMGRAAKAQPATPSTVTIKG